MTYLPAKPPHLPAAVRCLHGSPRRVRRGVAVLLLLAFMCIAMSLSYSLIRSTTTSVMVSGNHQRRVIARNAAMTGLMIARRQIHDASWDGIHSTVSGSLGPDVEYQVSYEVGDADLAPHDPNYSEYPYRLTIVSRGTARDPANSAAQSTSEIRAVMQLVRRSVTPPPSQWNLLAPFTLLQWDDREVDFKLPMRVSGRVYCGGSFHLADDIPELESGGMDGRLDEVAYFDKDLDPSIFADIYLASAGYSNRYRDVVKAYEAQNPVHWWRFNDSFFSETAKDSGRERWDGFYRGPQPGVAGPSFAHQSSNRAILLDGVNDYVELGFGELTRIQSESDGSEIDPDDPFRGSKGTRRPFTIAAWVYLDTLSASEITLFSKTVGSATGDYDVAFSLVPDGSAYMMQTRVRTREGMNVATASTGKIELGRWYFLGTTYDGRIINFYRNGVKVEDWPVLYGGDPLSHPGAPVQIGAGPAIRTRLLNDLGRLYRDKGQDLRPFDGPLAFNYWATPKGTNANLRRDLGLTTSGAIPFSSSSLPEFTSAYRLYPGGPAYLIPEVPNEASGLQLGPDPKRNPLGVFHYDSSKTLAADCSLQGVLFGRSGAKLMLDGPRISLQGLDLPPLDTGEVHQLPVLISEGPIEVGPAAKVSIAGCGVIDDRFEIRPGKQTDAFRWTGQLLTREIRVRERDEWKQSNAWWGRRLADFLRQSGSESSIAYFSEYLKASDGLTPEPNILIQRADPVRSYHWHDWRQPVFQPHPDDPGLRWEMIRMRETP